MNAEGGAGGGGTNIHLEFEEMITISNKLKASAIFIQKGFRRKSKPLRIRFYKAGQASKAIESYADILGKTMELFDNYCIASHIVSYAMEKCMKQIKSSKTLQDSEIEMRRSSNGCEYVPEEWQGMKDGLDALTGGQYGGGMKSGLIKLNDLLEDIESKSKTRTATGRSALPTPAKKQDRGTV
ncbi:hypothetical protein PO124_19595 [Bacillus licheniformis]|nr:hypothetical protein [Bacillus licheniformis]